MRQLDNLFKKLNLVSEHQHLEKSPCPEGIQQKLSRASTTLSKMTRKLDHMAGDFGSRESEDGRYQAA